MTHDTVIVGGGLAGLAAAQALASQGVPALLLEARPRLGGRASSFQDAATGEWVDACQHVSMGCCTNLHHFFHTFGMADWLEPQEELTFLTGDGRVSAWRLDPWPAPFHLARAFAGLHFLTPLDKLRIGAALLALQRRSPDRDEPLVPWLHRQGQSAAAMARFWSVILVSALNETLDRMGVQYARKVLVDGFMRHPRGSVVAIPRVPLGRLYGAEMQAWFEPRGVTLRWGAAVRRLERQRGGRWSVVLRDGERLSARTVILAVQPERVLDLIEVAVADDLPELAGLPELEYAPIVSVHLWFAGPITPRPHVVLVDRPTHWLFNRGVNSRGEHYVQLVISAAHGWNGWSAEAIRAAVWPDVQLIHGDSPLPLLHHCRVVTEKTATFSVRPGVDQLRPPQATSQPGLFLAGDWTRTGWPATMEGAVRSGYLAAEAVLAEGGLPCRCVQPDLR